MSAVQGASANRHGVDFSGHWELDYQMSDHPNEKIRWLYTKAKSEYERALERARNGANVRVDPRGYNYQSIIGLGRLAEKIAQATILDIEQAEDHIVIKRNDDFSLVCDFNAPQPTATPVGSEACTWLEDQLAFQIELSDGLTVYHLISIASNRERMSIATTVHVSSLPYPFTLNRVYMPYEPGEGMYNCEYTIAKQTTCTLGGSETE